MFTGLVETTGTLRARLDRGSGYRIEIATTLGPLTLGESISVDGACLTVVEMDGEGFAADVSAETARLTTLGDRTTGDAVNLERSLALGDRLGGHLVTGHVDGIASVRGLRADGEATWIEIEAPAGLGKYIAAKGSVALDGVSLTVNGLTPNGGFHVMIIPHTMEVTNLSRLTPGVRLNLEIDLVARYVTRYLEATASEPGADVAAALDRAGLR